MPRTRSLLLVGSPSWTQALELSLKESFPKAVTASSGGEARHLVREHHPTLAVVQARLPDEGGLLLIDALATGAAPIPAVFLSLFPSDLQVRLAWAYGALGVVSEYCGLHCLHKTIIMPAEGRRTSYRSLPLTLRPRERQRTRLTERQLAVLNQMARAPLHKLVTTALGFSEDALGRHLRNLRQKLHASSNSELVPRAAELGLVPTTSPKETPRRT